MYKRGSRHSSSVGVYDGASSMPNGLFFGFAGSRAALGCPLLSTDVRSSGGLMSALNGFCGFVGWYPLALILSFERVAPPIREGVLLAGELRALIVDGTALLLAAGAGPMTACAG
jgi:hypothetical protein